MPTKARLQYADGRTEEIEIDDVCVSRLWFNGKWFRKTDDDPDDAMPTYKEDQAEDGAARHAVTVLSNPEMSLKRIDEPDMSGSRVNRPE